MRKKKPVFSILTILFLIINLNPLYADTITLKSGEKIEGTIQKKTDSSVTIGISDKSTKYLTDQIEAITYSTDTFSESPLEPDPAAVDINNAEYPEIYRTIKNFFEHRTDSDSTESMKSISKNFRADDWMSPGQILNYDTLAKILVNPPPNDPPVKILSVQDFIIKKMRIAEYSATALTTAFFRVKWLADGSEELIPKRWVLLLKKEAEGWKITNMNRITSFPPLGAEQDSLFSSAMERIIQ